MLMPLSRLGTLYRLIRALSRPPLALSVTSQGIYWNRPAAAYCQREKRTYLFSLLERQLLAALCAVQMLSAVRILGLAKGRMSSHSPTQILHLIQNSNPLRRKE